MTESRKSKFAVGRRHGAAPAVLLLLFALLLVAGCEKSRYYRWNLRHSKNIATPEKDWPGNPEKYLTMAQREVFEARGRPDWIRFWWEGPFDNYSTTINPKFLSPQEIGETQQSWIYVREGDEVVFDNPFQSRSVAITPKLAIVIREGDPQERKYVNDPEGGEIEIWTYYSSGMLYRFKGDDLVDAKRLSGPMGPWLRG